MHLMHRDRERDGVAQPHLAIRPPLHTIIRRGDRGQGSRQGYLREDRRSVCIGHADESVRAAGAPTAGPIRGAHRGRSACVSWAYYGDSGSCLGERPSLKEYARLLPMSSYLNERARRNDFIVGRRGRIVSSACASQLSAVQDGYVLSATPSRFACSTAVMIDQGPVLTRRVS